jgi:hypothetical protein
MTLNETNKSSSNSAIQEKLNRPLEDLIKESKKQNPKKNQNPRHLKPKGQNKAAKKGNKPMAKQPGASTSLGLNPSKVHVTIRNEFAKPHMSGSSISRGHRMDIDSPLDYGRPVHKPKKPFRPPPSRQPRIVKP